METHTSNVSLNTSGGRDSEAGSQGSSCDEWVDQVSSHGFRIKTAWHSPDHPQCICHGSTFCPKYRTQMAWEHTCSRCCKPAMHTVDTYLLVCSGQTARIARCSRRPDAGNHVTRAVVRMLIIMPGLHQCHLVHGQLIVRPELTRP